jgi:hypothetical protein
MSTKTFLDEQLLAIQELSTIAAPHIDHAAHINEILTIAKRKIKVDLQEQVNNSLAIACLVGWCFAVLPPDKAKAWVDDVLGEIGETK